MSCVNVGDRIVSGGQSLPHELRAYPARSRIDHSERIGLRTRDNRRDTFFCAVRPDQETGEPLLAIALFLYISQAAYDAFAYVDIRSDNRHPGARAYGASTALCLASVTIGRTRATSEIVE